MTAEIALIVAQDRRRAIGNAGRLPWHLPDDLRHFKSLTLGHTVIMGRKTYESIGRALPGRQNWVLSRDAEWQAPGVLRVDSWPAALARHQHQAGILWVIGGGEIYRAALGDVSRIELTEVHTTLADADTYFPPLPADDWIELSRTTHPMDDRHAHAFDLVSLRRRQLI